MKRSDIDYAIERAISNAKKYGVALPLWAEWNPEEFEKNADGIRHQKLGWKVVDFGLGDFEHCGLVIFVLCSALVDELGEPLAKPSCIGNYEYPVTSFSRKYLFVQAGQTEPHHFHRQKARKEVSVIAGSPVRFELAWAENDTTLSSKKVDVAIDGIWHNLPAGGAVMVNPGETITLPGNLSHVISVAEGGPDSIMLETSTANNDRNDNIFPFMTPTSKPVEEDTKARYQLLDEHEVTAAADYQQNADSIFNQLYYIWFEFEKNDPLVWDSEIWRKANTMDSVLRYFEQPLTSDEQKLKAVQLLTDGWKFYLSKKNVGWWVDDFGWVAMFAMNVFDLLSGPNAPTLPFNAEEMLSEAQYCHKRMLENLDQQSGGIYNIHDSNKERRRNTVTNSLFWTLSTRLAKTNTEYAEYADKWYAWLLSGTWNGNTPQDWGFLNDLNIARETALGAAEPSAHSKEWFWSGDQGCVLAALMYYGMFRRAEQPTVSKIALNLINGCLPAGTPFFDQQNILHESDFPDNFSNNFADYSNDYATGKGVLLRHFAGFAPSVQGVDAAVLKTRFCATADAVWNTREKYDQVARDWNPYAGPQGEKEAPGGLALWQQVLQTGGLDATVAAVRIVRE